ncbi:MAG: DNRLRE domain-containing protein [Planctomycetes bacterium]|nr:DNRLRE domain-containing protein [Planctomycetota bacterium]
MTSNPLGLATALTTAALFTSTASAQSGVTLMPVQDTTLYESATGALANGSGASIFVGRSGGTSGSAARRALLQFDLTGALPPGAVILAAELVLFVEQTSATAPTTAFVHRVTSPWLEGSVAAPGNGGNGGPAVAGETTWLHRDFPNVLWANPGGDFDPTPSFTFELPITGAAPTGSPTGLVADLKNWIANPATNFGWLIKTDELAASTSRRCASREAAAMPPELRISYLNPGQTGNFGLPCNVGGSASQRFLLGIGVGPATGGSFIPLVYATGPANALGATFVSLGVDPVGTPLFPGCSAWLPLTGLLIRDSLFATDGSGTAQTGFGVPINAPGYLIGIQGVAIDTTAMGFTLSNACVLLTQ